MLVGLFHGATRVFLRPASSPADHLGDEVLESCRRHAMMGLVYSWVGVEAWIDHDPVNEIINHGGDAVDAAESLIKARQTIGIHRLLPQNDRTGSCGARTDDEFLPPHSTPYQAVTTGDSSQNGDQTDE